MHLCQNNGLYSATAANGSPIHVHGEIFLPILLPGLDIKQKCHIIKSPQYDVILGRDFLVNTSASINYASASITLCGNYNLDLTTQITPSVIHHSTPSNLAFPTPSEIPVINNTSYTYLESDSFAHMFEDTELPPYSETICNVYIDDDKPSSSIVLEGLQQLPERYNVLFCTALVSTEHISVAPCRVINPTAGIITLNAGLRMAKV